MPAGDRVLLHLSEFGRQLEGSYPSGMSQDGISARTGLGRAHVALALKSLREEGLVEELKGRVAGEARRRKLYALTDAGRARCRALLSAVMEMEVELRMGGGEPRRLRLSESSFLLPRKPSLVELALSVGEGGVLSVSADGTPPRAPRSGEGGEERRAEGSEEEKRGGGAEAGRRAGGLIAREGGEAERPPPASTPRPSPEAILMEVPETPGEAPLAGRVGPEAHPGAPPEPPRVVWGRLGAVVAGALALVTALILVSGRIGPPLPWHFLLMYFTTLATIEIALLFARGIPSGVRAELGIFAGTFLALAGGILVLVPPIQSLLLMAQGALFLLSGLLLCPLPLGRGFQTAGASSGAFMIFAGVMGLVRIDEPLLRLFSTLWIPAGALFIAPRLLPARASLASRLRSAAEMSTGLFLLAVGLFLFAKGLYPEGFVELVVGAVIIYYTAPRERDVWDATFLVIATMIGLVVVLTTITALIYLTRP
ncbi:MAG: hypothetical protein ACUVV6_02280 [Thermoplasmatota archaeon]